ncbi:hypothetical protein ZIOFF_040453 [Zingiber officinale]|uniref:Uncharacterized protein n=1 Tax=Zingiber officinale TaxID=94328 RepID=A0A8J5L4I9_ZINOF|nr:hypothetical protein ZIOFF_040453 [Zingiber officinale]
MLNIPNQHLLVLPKSVPLVPEGETKGLVEPSDQMLVMPGHRVLLLGAKRNGDALSEERKQNSAMWLGLEGRGRVAGTLRSRRQRIDSKGRGSARRFSRRRRLWLGHQRPVLGTPRQGLRRCRAGTNTERRSHSCGHTAKRCKCCTMLTERFSCHKSVVDTARKLLVSMLNILNQHLLVLPKSVPLVPEGETKGLAEPSDQMLVMPGHRVLLLGAKRNGDALSEEGKQNLAMWLGLEGRGRVAGTLRSTAAEDRHQGKRIGSALLQAASAVARAPAAGARNSTTRATAVSRGHKHREEKASASPLLVVSSFGISPKGFLPFKLGLESPPFLDPPSLIDLQSLLLFLYELELSGNDGASGGGNVACYDGSVADWEDYSRYVNHDGIEVSPHFPVAYFQPPLPTNVPYTTNQNSSSKVNISTSTTTDVAPTPVDTTQASSNGYQDLRYGFDGMWSPISWYDGSVFVDGQQRHTSTNNASSMSPHVANTTSIRNQNLRPLPHLMVDLAIELIEDLLGVIQNAPQSIARARSALKYILLPIFAHVDDVLAKYKMSKVRNLVSETEAAEHKLYSQLKDRGQKGERRRWQIAVTEALVSDSTSKDRSKALTGIGKVG